MRKEPKLASKINCPRCGSNNITEVEHSLAAGNDKVNAVKQKCNDCNTRFYFEEQIIDYLTVITALIPAKE